MAIQLRFTILGPSAGYDNETTSQFSVSYRVPSKAIHTGRLFDAPAYWLASNPIFS